MQENRCSEEIENKKFAGVFSKEVSSIWVLSLPRMRLEREKILHKNNVIPKIYCRLYFYCGYFCMGKLVDIKLYV
jgi:5-methylthioribose kinase